MDIPIELGDQLRRGNVLLFCGAGISLSEGGLPSGWQLAQELAQRIGLETLGATLPEVAQTYEQKIGRHSLVDYIINRIDQREITPLRTHQLIAALPFKLIVTTNWDNLQEEALRQARKPFVKIVRDTDVPYHDELKVLLVKLHGTLEQADSLVVTSDDYEDVFARMPVVTNVVRSYFATKTILFVGFGLADADFKHLYREIERHLGKHTRRAYAVQLHPQALIVDYWQRKNLQVIAADAATFLAQIADVQ